MFESNDLFYLLTERIKKIGFSKGKNHLDHLPSLQLNCDQKKFVHLVNKIVSILKFDYIYISSIEVFIRFQIYLNNWSLLDLQTNFNHLIISFLFLCALKIITININNLVLFAINIKPNNCCRITSTPILAWRAILRQTIE